MQLGLWKNECGAIVSDWVVVGASVVGLGAAAALMLSGSTEDLAGDVQRNLTQTTVSTPDLDFQVNGPPATQLDAIEYASYVGKSDDSGGTIDNDTINGVIADKNALSDSQLQQEYATGVMIGPMQRPSALGQLKQDVVTDLLIERGYNPPWEEAPIYNTTPTSLTADDFAELWDGETALTTRAAVVAAIVEFDTLHDLNLPAALETAETKWEYIIIEALMEERGLSEPATKG